MKYNECRICGSHVDAGELVNGICLDCLEEKEKEKDIQYRLTSVQGKDGDRAGAFPITLVNSCPYIGTAILLPLES